MKKRLSKRKSFMLMLMLGAIGYGSSKLLVEYFGFGRLQAQDFINLKNEVNLMKGCKPNNTTQ